MRKFRKIILTLIACLMMASCAAPAEDQPSGSAAVDQPQQGGTYIVRGAGDPYSFNPDLRVDDWASSRIRICSTVLSNRRFPMKLSAIWQKAGVQRRRPDADVPSASGCDLA